MIGYGGASRYLDCWLYRLFRHGMPALSYFEGCSIGSDDMTQLTLGLDRDSALDASGFDERTPPSSTSGSAAHQAKSGHKILVQLHPNCVA